MGHEAVTHCPRVPSSRSTLKLGETGTLGSWLCSLACQQLPQPSPENRTQGLPTLTRHQQKANEPYRKPKPGEQARSTLPAPLVAPVSHTLSKGLSHGVKGSASQGLCWQLALTIPDKTGEPAKGLHKGYPSPERTYEEVMV